MVEIRTDDDGKITGVADKWNGEIPEGAFTKVCLFITFMVCGLVVWCSVFTGVTGMKTCSDFWSWNVLTVCDRLFVT